MDTDDHAPAAAAGEAPAARRDDLRAIAFFWLRNEQACFERDLWGRLRSALSHTLTVATDSSEPREAIFSTRTRSLYYYMAA